MYRVLIHDDPITPMEFVVRVLQKIFRLDARVSREVMLEAHAEEVAQVGVYAFERAEFLIGRAHSVSRTAKYPLTFTMERV